MKCKVPLLQGQEKERGRKMSEQITGEQLEKASYDKPNCTAHCHECGEKIDTDQEIYGISRDGERHCCYECLDNVIRLSSLHYTHRGIFGGFAEHGKGNDRVIVEVRANSQQEALKKAEEYAGYTLEGVNAYVED